MDDATPPVSRRPLPVWIISIFYFVSAGWVVLSFARILSGSVSLSLSDAQQAYFSSLTVVDYTVTIGIGLANLAGAINLFILRKSSFQWILSAFVLGIAHIVWLVLTKGWLSAVGGLGIVGVLWGWTVNVAVLIYTRNLIKNGVLQ